jgi:hypothetical protein
VSTTKGNHINPCHRSYYIKLANMSDMKRDNCRNCGESYHLDVFLKILNSALDKENFSNMIYAHNMDIFSSVTGQHFFF